MAIHLILRAATLTLSQLGDPRFRRVLFMGVGLTIALLVAATAALLLGLNWLVGPEATLPWIGPVTWVNDLLTFGGVFFMLAASVFLMVPVASAITSLFLDGVAEAVEERHYPQLPPVGPQSMTEALKDSLSFLGVLIVANLFALVLYVMFAPFAPFIFWGLNGYLLGREYFTLAAMRRVGREEAGRQRKRHLLTIWTAGVMMAIPLTVPILNLLVPILGAATFTHLFHLLNRR